MSGLNGIVYTRDWVVSLVLDISGYTSDKPLWKKIAVEPSCGQGAFLNRLTERLLFAAKRDGVLDREHIENSIRAFDLDDEAVLTSRSLICKKLLAHGFSEEDARLITERWVQQGDYLLQDKIPADFVIGNPPYLRATEIPKYARDRYVKTLSSMTRGCDLFVGFFQKGLESLRDKDGVLCFICADRWMQNQYGKKLRALISHSYHIDTLVRMHGVDAFEANVSAYPAITRIDCGSGKIKYADCSSSFSEGNAKELIGWLQSTLFNYSSSVFSAMQLEQPQGDAIIPLSRPETVQSVLKFMDKYPSLEQTGVRLGIGLATGKDDVYIVDNPDVAEPDRMLPMFNMRDWRRKGSTDKNWLVNPWNRDGNLVSLPDYPLLQSYFEKHRDDIEARHVARKNSAGWYRTIDKINWSILGTPMLLFPDMAMNADPVYSDGTRYPCHNCYWVVSDKWDIKVLGGLLMSDMAESFIDAMGVKMRGGTKRFQAQYLRLIHVPPPDSIPAEVADMLRIAFETNDREAASRAALLAYRMG